MSGLTLLAPLSLLGLLALPLIWWILRISPPRPRQQVFPPLPILRGVETDEETPNAVPWWLLVFRMLMVALAVFALSMPLLTSDDAQESRPLTLVVDDSALSAPVWDELLDEARREVRAARRANEDVVLVIGDGETQAVPASEALNRLRSAQPRSVATPSRVPELPSGRRTLFLTSGAALGDAEAPRALRDAGATIVLPAASAGVIVPGDVRETADGFEADWHAVSGGRVATVQALNGRGDVLAASDITFAPGQTLATASISLPPQLRSRVARLKVAGTRASVSTLLLDDSFGRPLVGVLAPASGTSSPLLSEDFYAEQALAPNADLFIGDPAAVLSLNPSVLVMPDVMASDAPEIVDYIESGGVLVRFAGPQLAKAPDALVPVELRTGGRSIGGALAWETPQRLAPFPAESPFAGLPVPADITVSRQVMARPGAETDARTWARLEDGSPVVTASVRGEGRVILFHVTAGPEWSNLAISGLYVDMLKRILPLAKSRPSVSSASSGDWVLDRQLGPFGQLRAPPPQVVSISDAELSDPPADQLPGLYRQGTRTVALNAVRDPQTLSALNMRALDVVRMSGRDPRSLAGTLLGIALGLLALDMLLSAWLSGKLSRLRPARALATAAVLAMAFAAAPDAAMAQDDTRVRDAALGLHLAYVETGDARIDSLSDTGLQSLSRQLTQRTTIEPVGVHGVSPDDAGLELYPFLYWPIRLDTPALTEEERTNINRYIAAGGTLVLDTADEAERGLRAGAPHPGLARVTDGLNIGRLAKVPEDHVLTKSFYLMQVFPGRWANGPVFVEASGATSGGRDGVSAAIIGSNGWAAAWARDETIGTLVDLSNDIPRQREIAARFGVNLAMYTLSGNYKADQVHAAELVERLGRQVP